MKTSGLMGLRPRFKLITIAPILAIMALLCWALASPMLSSPDDVFHLPSIWCAAGEKVNACNIVADENKREVPKVLTRGACFAFNPKQSAACQGTGFGDEHHVMITTGVGNFQRLYPPIYYRTMNFFVGSSITLSIVLMRFFNILLLVGLATLLYELLPNTRRLSLLWGLAISLVPLGLFLASSNNPSAWAIISAGTLWISLIGYFETSGARKAGLGAIAALSTVVGAGARSDSAVYAVVAVVVASLLTARLNRRWFVSALLPLALVVTASTFYFSTQQALVASSGLNGFDDPKHHLGTMELLIKNLLDVPSLWAGVFGSWKLGWLDTVMPAIVWVGSLSCFVVFVFAGLVSLSIRKVLALLIVLSALWLAPTVVLVQSGTTVGHGVQPRYLLPLIVMLAGVASFQVGKARLSLSTGQVVALVSTLSVANAIALHVNMRRYITGVNITGLDLNAGIKWWWDIPLSPMVVWVAGSLSFSAFLVIIAMATVLTRSSEMPHPETLPISSS